MPHDPIRFECDPGYRRMVDAAKRGGRAKSRAKLEAVKRNLAKARSARVEKAREAERRRAMGISAKDFHADMARRRAAGLPFQPWLEWKAAREAELFGGGFEIE